jgi:UDP-2,3-diacylglucosamine hydrolase
MAERKGVYFVSDVHLGLAVKDPSEREARFVSFLRGIPRDTTLALYMLGDIWDFWYEYRDVVPKGSVRVFAALMDLMDAGVKVYFFPGNHDIWCYGYFESMGIKVVREQPQLVEIGGKVFCIGHGDGLGPGLRGYKFMNAVFKCRFVQRLFSTLHPWLAFRLGNGWSRHSRLARNEQYEFKGADEPLYKWAEEFSERTHVDCFIFGHLHAQADLTLPSGARLVVMKDWMEQSQYWYFDGILVGVGHSMNTE